MTTKQSFPPDFVSASTLAHRLDCSKTTINSYVARGLLPKPTRIGELVRWRWVDIEAFPANGAEAHADANDPYLAGIERGTTKEASY